MLFTYEIDQLHYQKLYVYLDLIRESCDSSSGFYYCLSSFRRQEMLRTLELQLNIEKERLNILKI